LVTSTDYLLSI